MTACQLFTTFENFQVAKMIIVQILFYCALFFIMSWRIGLMIDLSITI